MGSLVCHWFLSIALFTALLEQKKHESKGGIYHNITHVIH